MERAPWSARVLCALILLGGIIMAATACGAPPQAEPAMCGVARTVPDTVLAYPDGSACLGSGYGHVIVVNKPCGVLLSTHAEDDRCVRFHKESLKDWGIFPLSEHTASDGPYVTVD